MKQWIASHGRLFKWFAVALAFAVLAVFVSLTSATVVTLFLVVLALRLDIRFPLALALLLLCASAVLMGAGQRPQATSCAEWAYYFLAMGVVLQIVAYVRAQRRTEASPPEEERPQ